MIFTRSAFVLLLVFTVSLCESENKNDTTTATPPTLAPTTANTTTELPTTTPSPVTIPPPPTPAPVNNSEWAVAYDNKTVCILAKMNITVKVPYFSKASNETVAKQFELDPSNTNSIGNCSLSNITQSLTVIGDNITVTFRFVQNVTESNYELDAINVMLKVNNFTLPNSNLTGILNLNHTKPEFTTPSKKSYVCSNPDPLPLNSTEAPSANVILSNVHIEAFGTKTDRSFSDALDCNTFETPDIVPIAVGCALAALVIVVLISYLVGRRRSQARGYLSM